MKTNQYEDYFFNLGVMIRLVNGDRNGDRNADWSTKPVNTESLIFTASYEFQRLSLGIGYDLNINISPVKMSNPMLRVNMTGLPLMNVVCAWALSHHLT